jgi:hypothetical protein
VVPPHVLQSVEDLPLPVPLGDDDQVEHPGGHERLVFGVPLDEQLAERRLDPAGRRVLLGPEVLAQIALQR